MILTRSYLNPRRRDARKLLASPQAMHAAIRSGFPPNADPGRVLWRMDAEGPSATVWIVSADTPDLTHLEEQAGWPSRSTTKSIAYGGLLRALDVDQAWAFRLTANPTHRAQHNGKKKVFAHVTAEQQTQWLLDRQEQLGVKLHTGAETPTFTLVGRDTKRFRRGQSTVTLGVAPFSGALEVVDPDLLRTALTSGVGRGKAYGCGLLTLARP